MNLINNQQKMLDILFAKRNKSYGAYAIRSAYGSTVFRSLFIVIFTIASSLGLATWLKDAPIDGVAVLPNEQDTGIHVIIDPVIDLPPVIDPPTNHGGSGSLANSTPTVVDHNIVDTAQVSMTNTAVSQSTATGTDPGPDTPSLTGTGTPTTVGGGGDPVEGYGVDENPEFEGGHAALLAFVRRNLVYPPMAVEEGKQGTVYAKFVVDETGKVSNILLQNNLGFGLDDEAMRVLKMIPKFKSPGKVQGKPVKTFYQIPIKFKLG
jgi:protein TonB